MMKAIVSIVAMMAISTTAQAEPPKWETLQTVDSMGAKATELSLPPGKIVITITMQEKGVRPSATCLAMDMGGRFMAGEIAQKDNTCTMSFIAHDPQQPVLFMITNQDFIFHTYLFRVFYTQQPNKTK